MSRKLHSAIDDYVNRQVVREDAALRAARTASERAGLPPIAVSPGLGKLLHLLARIQGARRILEFGTLGGYSTIWLARALPADGRLLTLELDPHHAEVARRNIAHAGLSPVVDVRVGRALDLLPGIEAEGLGPFDFFFIDADKANIPDYFKWSLRLSRPGSVVVVDNVIRRGRVLEAASKDPSVRGVRRFNRLLAAEPRVSATTIQTADGKGHDGFAVVRVE